MPRIKASFENQQGEALAGLLETPDAEPLAYALFAHCFTCSKDIAAASRISRALAALGIAVLRFDFTGLGNSDGDFANTNFSSNVQDLIAAAQYLESQHQPPAMLIGHSLGGAAVLAAAHAIPAAKAVVTIGAPATAEHVEHLFKNKRAEILEHEHATVELGGREFTIKRQFLDDLAEHNDREHISTLKKHYWYFTPQSMQPYPSMRRQKSTRLPNIQRASCPWTRPTTCCPSVKTPNMWRQRSRPGQDVILHWTEPRRNAPAARHHPCRRAIYA